MASTEEEQRDAYLRTLGYPGYNQPHPHDRGQTASTIEHPAGEVARKAPHPPHDREGARGMNDRAAPTDPTGHRGGCFLFCGAAHRCRARCAGDLFWWLVPTCLGQDRI